MRSEVRAGDVAAFNAWLVTRGAPAHDDDDERLFSCLPINHCPFLPPNVAAIVINGEVRQMIKLDQEY